MNLFTCRVKRLNYVQNQGDNIMVTRKSKAELANRVQELEKQLANSKTARDVREMVHTMINFTNDEIGRTLVDATSHEWCANHNMDMLTIGQAETLMNVLSELVKQSSFKILSKA